MNEGQALLGRGFLPLKDPLEVLPQQYNPWEAIGHELPKLLVANRVVTTFDQLPVLDVSGLEKPAELERAMLLLSFFGHAYIWGEKTPKNYVPTSIAIPWYQVASKLHRPPVLSYDSYALNNWRRLDKSGPVALGNIVLLQNFLGGIDEEWFVLVHVDIEMKAAAALEHFINAQASVKRDDYQQLLEYLKIFAQVLDQMCNTLARMPERCDPYIYYNRVRPYLHAGKDNPSLPEGIIYKGVEAYGNKPQLFRGETGAQSSIIPCFDALFGITHQEDPLRIYLREMRDYMPLAHRRFLETIEEGGSIREYVIANYSKEPLLREYYNNCLQLISKFRQTHLRFAAHYIQKQSQSSQANPTQVGTGGTPFMNYLRKHKDETLRYLIDK